MLTTARTIIVEKIGALILRLRGMDITSHVAVIDKGHIVYRDSIDGLKANDDVK